MDGATDEFPSGSIIFSVRRISTHIIILIPSQPISSRQIKTALGDLQRVDEKSIVELGDSGEHLFST